MNRTTVFSARVLYSGAEDALRISCPDLVGDQAGVVTLHGVLKTDGTRNQVFLITNPSGFVAGFACLCPDGWLFWIVRDQGGAEEVVRRLLYQTIETRLRRASVPFLRVAVVTDSPDDAFFADLGFERLSTIVELERNLRDWQPLTSFPYRLAEGISVNSLEEERGRTFRWVYELHQLQRRLVKEGALIKNFSLGQFIRELCNLSGSHPRYFVGRLLHRSVGLVRVERDLVWSDRVVITALGVLKKYQGKGIGTCLLHRAFQWAKDGGYQRVGLIGFADEQAVAWLRRKIGFGRPTEYVVFYGEKVFQRPYQPQWVRFFEKERETIIRLLANGDRLVEHIGATAIPGCLSRPIVDILVGVSDEEVERARDALEKAGYSRKKAPAGMEKAIWLCKRVNGRTATQIILCDPRHPLWKSFLLFRNYLRTRIAIAEQYGMMKEKLAAQHPFDLRLYERGKAGFIEIVLARARGL
ncbi:MAG: GNAT family N-acetyltransferase [Armatimonadetes bacterium]|nr:GNAT family N-acetyltransferase [Armatimonadota bacterium]MDW8121740.1 GNAT family N-acetyltransferase [Armatimonadota bacterium]